MIRDFIAAQPRKRRLEIRRNTAARFAVDALERRWMLAAAPAVVNLSPLPSFTGPDTALEGSPYSLHLSSGALDPATVTHWTVDWGDGGAPETLAGNPAEATHVYANAPTAHPISATVSTEASDWKAIGPSGVDEGFGAGGVVTGDFVSSNYVGGTAQPDGKLLLVNENGSALHRFDSKGAPDPEFQGDGPAARLPEGYISPKAIAVQPDGKILAAGWTIIVGPPYVEPMIAARYNVDGSLDTTFNGQGYIRIDFGEFRDIARVLAVQPDGKILVGGAMAKGASYNTSPEKFALARLNADGTLDPSFGDGGKVVTDPGPAYDDGIGQLAVLADGKILAAMAPSRDGGGAVAFVCYNPDGSLDPGFGDGGVAGFSLPSSSRFGTPVFTLMPDGKIVTAGAMDLSLGPDVVLHRLTADGKADPSFGPDGMQTISLGGSRMVGIAADAEGRLLLGGASPSRWVAARLLPDGSFDPTLNDGGIVAIDPTDRPDAATTMLVMPDGDVVLGGMTGTQFVDDRGLIVRFNIFDSLAVRNPPPTITVDAPSVAFVPGTAALHFNYSGVPDVALQSWLIDWGDGVTTPLGADATSASHAYAATGAYAVRVTAKNEDGPYTSTRLIYVAQAPALAADGTLTISGSPLADSITVNGVGDVLKVEVDGQAWEFPAANVTRVKISSLAGNDKVSVGAGVPGGEIDLGGGFDKLSFTTIPAAFIVDGGTENDEIELHGSAGDDVFNVTAAGLSIGGNPIVSTTSVESLSVYGEAGDDTFGGDGRDLALTLDGGGGNDRFTFQSVRMLTIRGGPGDDSFEIKPYVAYARIDGGEGDDALTVFGGPGGGGGPPTGADFFSIYDRDGAPVISLTNSRIDPVAVESFTLVGGPGGDNFFVSIVPAGWHVQINTAGGSDTLQFQDVARPGSQGTGTNFLGDVSIDGGGGDRPDRLNITYGWPDGDVFTLTGTAYSREHGGGLTYSGIGPISLTTGSGADTIRVTPSADSVISVNAGAPTTAPGDRLEINLAGATGARLAANGKTFFFANRKEVQFQGVESYTDIVGPRATPAGYDPLTRTVKFTFDEPVALDSLQPADVTAKAAANDAITPATAVAYDAATRTASFSFDPLPPGIYNATLGVGSVLDSLGNPSGSADAVEFAVHGVGGRHVFYNNSAYDNYDAGVGFGDVFNVAPDKTALTPGRIPTAANVTSYTRGLNGVAVDITAGPDGAFGLTLDDFGFRVGMSGNPDDWVEAPTPMYSFGVGLSVIPGELTRFLIAWPDGAIRNTWLQVTVKPSKRTGLSEPDVFYFGNLVADTGDSDANFAVGAADLVRTRNGIGTGPADLSSKFDYNRDGRIDAADLVLSRNNIGHTLSMFGAPALQAAPMSDRAGRPGWKPTAGPFSAAAITLTDFTDRRRRDETLQS